MAELREKRGRENCHCISIGDCAVLDMANDGVLFATLTDVKARGTPWWWLSLEICRECGQNWLVASEEAQNDVLCLRSLEVYTAERIVQEDLWPSDFDRYETLLEMGRDAGHKATFGKVTSADHPLIWNITNLAKERPGIHISRISSLLNLTPSRATRYAQTAVEVSGVKIEFD